MARLGNLTVVVRSACAGLSGNDFTVSRCSAADRETDFSGVEIRTGPSMRISIASWNAHPDDRRQLRHVERPSGDANDKTFKSLDHWGADLRAIEQPSVAGGAGLNVRITIISTSTGSPATTLADANKRRPAACSPPPSRCRRPLRATGGNHVVRLIDARPIPRQLCYWPNERTHPRMKMHVVSPAHRLPARGRGHASSRQRCLMASGGIESGATYVLTRLVSFGVAEDQRGELSRHAPKVTALRAIRLRPLKAQGDVCRISRHEVAVAGQQRHCRAGIHATHP